MGVFFVYFSTLTQKIMLQNPQKIAQTTAICAALLMVMVPYAVVAQNHLHPLPVLEDGLPIKCVKNGIEGFVMIPSPPPPEGGVFCKKWRLEEGLFDSDSPSILGGSIPVESLTPKQKDALRAVTEAQGQSY